MSTLTKIGLEVLAVVLYTVMCAFGGYEYAQTSIAQQQTKQAIKSVAAEQKLETENAVAAAPVVKTITQIQWRTQIITKEVPIIQTIEVPGQCPDQRPVECPAAITAADRVLIDAAARGIDSSAGSSPDGPAYPAGPLTSSVIANYGRCNTCIAQLTGLQNYVARTLAEQKLLCPRP